MSVYVTGHVWKHSQHKGSALLLLLYLADCAHDDGTSIYPSVGSMGRATRLSERNVQYLLGTLTASGELQEDGMSEYKTRRFSIPVQSLHPATERAEGVQPSVKKGALDCTQSVIGDPYKKPIRHTAEKSIVPPDFTLDEADHVFAAGRGMPVSEIGHEFEKFRNYHESKGNRFKDWHKAWRTWAMNFRPTTRATHPAPRAEPRYQGSQTGVAELPPDVLKRFEVR